MTTHPIDLASEPESAIPERVYSTGMYLALAGILMFFTGLVSAWVVRKGLSASTLEAPLEFPRGLILLDTFALIASNITLQIAWRALRAGKAENFRRWFYATSVLGIAFLVGQITAWRLMIAAGVYFASNPDASFLYLFTASHGIFLLTGIATLLIVARRKSDRTALETRVRVAGTYWHFLTALWCMLCALLMANTNW